MFASESEVSTGSLKVCSKTSLEYLMARKTFKSSAYGEKTTIRKYKRDATPATSRLESKGSGLRTLRYTRFDTKRICESVVRFNYLLTIVPRISKLFTQWVDVFILNRTLYGRGIFVRDNVKGTGVSNTVPPRSQYFEILYPEGRFLPESKRKKVEDFASDVCKIVGVASPL